MMLMLCAVYVPFAHAGVSLKLEHPRYPSQVQDEYKVNCEKDCAVEILSDDSGKVTAAQEPLSKKIKELMNLHVQGFLPKEPANKKRILYKLKATDGEKTFDLIIGYPMSYEGSEYSKFTQLISVIEEIKRIMRTEIREKK